MAPHNFENSYRRETLEWSPEDEEELHEDQNEWWEEGPEEPSRALWHEAVENREEGLRPEALDAQQERLRQETEDLASRIENPEVREDLSRITNLELRREHALRHLRLQEIGDEFQKGTPTEDLGVGEQAERTHDLAHRRANAKLGTSLLAHGMSWDHLGSLSDEYDALIQGPEHHDNLMRAREMVRGKDLDALQEDIDRDLEDGKIPKSWHDLIAREIRMAKVDGH